MRITVAGDGCWPFFFPVAMTSRAAMSRALFWFSGSAALMVAISVALPHSGGLDEAGLASCAVLAAAIAALAITAYDALPRWSFHGLVAAGAVIAATGSCDVGLLAVSAFEGNFCTGATKR